MKRIAGLCALQSDYCYVLPCRLGWLPARAGLARSELEARSQADISEALEADHAEMAAAGNRHVPPMIEKSEPFCGRGRFDRVLWRLGLWSTAKGGIPR